MPRDRHDSTGSAASMRFGVTIPNNWGIADPLQVLAMGPLAEALGYDSVWVMDHLLNSGYIRERLDDKPYYHPLATLSYLAATTKRVTLWTNADPRYRSERWNLAGFKFAPKPLQQPSIPLWVGGSSPGALRRAATMGDGWHPTGMSPDDFSAGREEVRKLATAAGRDPDTLTMSVRVEVEVSGRASSQRAAGRARLPGDSTDQMIAGIQAYQRAGAEHIVLALNSGEMARITALMADIAEKVMPQCRQAPDKTPTRRGPAC